MRYYLWPAGGVPLQNLPHRYVVKLTPLENHPESEQQLQERAIYSLLNGSHAAGGKTSWRRNCNRYRIRIRRTTNNRNASYRLRVCVLQREWLRHLRMEAR